MTRLSGLRLRVADPETLAAFYTTHLGMRLQRADGTWRLGYGSRGADLILIPDGAEPDNTRTARYWKIGITLPDLDLAAAQLATAGVQVTEPHQFGDIGYMCHLRDPAGFQIELLQHDFDGNRPPDAGNAALPLGGGAEIGQITLRSGDIAADGQLAENLGLRLLSVQPVPTHGFTLYFYGFTRDTPPNPDLAAVDNREWLWRRPYTTLEIQHLPNARITPSPCYAGLEIETDSGKSRTFTA